MTKYIALISGKGGVSKTTSSINLGSALNYFGKDVTVVDANLTTPNVGVYLGVPVVPINLHNVLQGRNHISEAVYLHPSGTKIVPASLSVDDLRNTNPDNLKRVLRGLKGTTDIVIIDCAAGLGREAVLALDACDEVMIVTNPELPAVTDALKTIKLAEEFGKRVIGVIVARKRDNTDMEIKNIESLLEHKVVAVIPEDGAIRDSLLRKDPVIYTNPGSESAIAYKKLAADFLGYDYDERPERKGFLSRIFGKFKG